MELTPDRPAPLYPTQEGSEASALQLGPSSPDSPTMIPPRSPGETSLLYDRGLGDESLPSAAPPIPTSLPMVPRAADSVLPPRPAERALVTGSDDTSAEPSLGGGEGDVAPDSLPMPSDVGDIPPTEPPSGVIVTSPDDDPDRGKQERPALPVQPAEATTEPAEVIDPTTERPEELFSEHTKVVVRPENEEQFRDILRALGEIGVDVEIVRPTELGDFNPELVNPVQDLGGETHLAITQRSLDGLVAEKYPDEVTSGKRSYNPLLGLNQMRRKLRPTIK